MKLWYKICTSKCVDVEFQRIYDYIKSENPNASVEDVYWMFCDDVDHYIQTLCDAPDFNAADNEYRTEDLCIAWSKWLKKNAEI